MSELFPELRRGTGTIEISPLLAHSLPWNQRMAEQGIYLCNQKAILKGKAKDRKGT